MTENPGASLDKNRVIAYGFGMESCSDRTFGLEALLLGLADSAGADRSMCGQRVSR
ncbi:hypothetical protein Spiaf_2398 [Spirochaeta africana DSM 8902]|uniref:Uncharacterized protein n=1 Tax=Spirochaeta africana (strain ATCC 700263 / DSM 8902 / Z-7692) TaxID=889378 RepID=H9ULN6_SPIAZ|nr:hypothetical protein Spiaf_2398 [Spirochaeta africana DSM 8902]